MRLLQYVGIFIGLAIGGYGVYKYRSRRYGKLDLLISLLISIGVLAVAINPAIVDILARLLGMQTRWFAALFISNIILLGLFFYTLNKVNKANRTVGELVRALAKKEYYKRETYEKHKKLIVIVIPAYNEEKAIGGVLRQMPQKVLEYQVEPIVIIDGADDRTEEIVIRENYFLANHLMNRGQGDALRTGFDIAISKGADLVMTMDADGQHRVEDIERLVKPIIQDEADYVMGSRFLGKYEDSGGVRHIGIVFFTLLINFLTRLHITDCTNGFRAINGTQLSKLELHENRFSAPELIIEASKKGLRIQEVPVTVVSRKAGKSKKPPKLSYPIGFLWVILKTWLR